MFRKLKAVSLAEMLIALGIIGILSVLALVTVKPQDKAYKFLYVRAYDVLGTATYNAMLSEDKFPDTSVAFCNLLLKFINSNDKTCTAPDLTNEAVAFPEESIKFVASNGMRFWIASDNGAPYVKKETITGTEYSLKYFTVFVDINGDKPPNSTLWVESKKMADIVAFVITESSVVIPLGPPEIDTRYMTATSIYPPDDEERPEGTHSNPTSYHFAKRISWGEAKAEAEPMSWDFRSILNVDSPFYVDYPTVDVPSVNGTMGCIETHNAISPCYVKVESYN